MSKVGQMNTAYQVTLGSSELHLPACLNTRVARNQLELSCSESRLTSTSSSREDSSGLVVEGFVQDKRINVSWRCVTTTKRLPQLTRIRLIGSNASRPGTRLVNSTVDRDPDAVDFLNGIFLVKDACLMMSQKILMKDEFVQS